MRHTPVQDAILIFLSRGPFGNNTIWNDSISNLALLLDIPRPSASRAISALIAKKLVRRAGLLNGLTLTEHGRLAAIATEQKSVLQLQAAEKAAKLAYARAMKAMNHWQQLRVRLGVKE